MKKVFLSLMVCCLAVACLTAEAAVKVACVGNSITFGYGLRNPMQDSYPSVLQRMLGDGYEVHNYGVSARTMLRKGDRPYFNEKAFRDALALKPDIVIIKLGTNDSKPENWKYGNEFEQDMNAIVDSFELHAPGAEIFLARPVPVREEKWGITEEVMSNEIYPIIHRIAQTRGLREIDLHKVFEGKLEHLADNIHPDAEGARMMAEEVYRVLQTPPTKKEAKALAKARKKYAKTR